MYQFMSLASMSAPLSSNSRTTTTVAFHKQLPEVEFDHEQVYPRYQGPFSSRSSSIFSLQSDFLAGLISFEFTVLIFAPESIGT
jgi:hypothetical protein